MSENTLFAWFLRIGRSKIGGKNGRWWRPVMLTSCLLITMTFWPAMLPGSNPPHPGAARLSPKDLREAQLLPRVHDSVYDQYLQRLRHLHGNSARRAYLGREVSIVATQNHIDPDLLFALVAVESNFNAKARSSKGARGLGQIMFPTAHAFAPQIVRQPNDLYDIHRNLNVTAKYLRQLLVENDGDLEAALSAYHYGSPESHSSARREDRYVARICTTFASLKARREYQQLLAMAPGDANRAEE